MKDKPSKDNDYMPKATLRKFFTREHIVQTLIAALIGLGIYLVGIFILSQVHIETLSPHTHVVLIILASLCGVGYYREISDLFKK